METPAMPLPSFRVFHASFGPDSGHCWSRPVAGKTPSRFGPRHWGLSLATQRTAPRTTVLRIKIEFIAGKESCWKVRFILDSIWIGDSPAEARRQAFSGRQKGREVQITLAFSFLARPISL